MDYKSKDMAPQEAIGACIVNMLFYVNQLHLAHWLTLKNHHHVVVGNLYEEVEEELDSLAEQFIGACLPEMKPEEALYLMEGTREPRYYKVIKTEKDIIKIIDEMTGYATDKLQLIEGSKKFSFLRDSLMDIIAALHSAKYQISQE